MKPLYFTILLQLLFATFSVSGQETTQLQPESTALESGVDPLMASYDRPDSPGAAIAVVVNGQVVFARGYGLANLEHGIPITTSTVFDIASVSKQFGAMAIAMLAKQGKLSLDDDIRKHIPEVPDFGKTITIRHLIHHTSGIRDWPGTLALAGWRMDDVISFEQILKMVEHQKELNFDPGEEYLYSNTGYNLLAETVARLTGQSFREWTDANIFEPLGMKSTHFQDDHQMLVRNKAYAYRSQGGEFKPLPNGLTALGSSSLFTTVEDLVKWALNFETARVGGKSVLEQVHEQGVLNNGKKISYAFGNSVGVYKGLKRVEHSGSWAGFRTYLARFPNQDFTVIVLSNVSNFNSSRKAMQITDLYLSEHFKEPDSEEPASASREGETVEIEPWRPNNQELVSFSGRYYSPELETFYTLAVEGDQLVARHRRHGDIKLTPHVQNVFNGSEWFFRTVEFGWEEIGVVVGMRVSNGRVRKVLFEKQ